MDLTTDLKYIRTVKANGRVNIELELNDGYVLLLEGSFAIFKKDEKLLDSQDYMNSNFKLEVLNEIQTLLEGQKIRLTTISEQTGTLLIELENNLKFRSFFEEGDYESWELSKNGSAVYGSECGSIVHY